MSTPMPANPAAPFARRLLRGALALAVSGVFAGCTSSAPVGNDLNVTMRPGSLSSSPAPRKLRDAGGEALIAGLAKGPAGLVGANIVSNNGSNIVAGHSSRYALAAVQEDPIANAIVYLTDPDERFFAIDGQPVMATTDAKGQYSFGTGVPADQVIVVNVMLADNRREVGYTVSKAGKNTIDVSLATTYVTEFLRDRASKVGKKMGDYDLAKLAELARLTQAALDAAELEVPDLAIGKINEMNQAYALAVGLNKQGLGDAWAKLLGERVLAVTTLAGTGEGGYGGDGKPALAAQLYKPKGLARDKDGNIYIADEGNHAVRVVSPDGKIATLVGNATPRFTGDGGPAKDAGLWWPRTVTVGPDKALYIADTLNMRIRRVDLESKVIETVAGNPDQANGAFLNDFAGDGGPASSAKLAGVRGMVFDSKGRLIFADTWDNDGGSWHHIRRIATDGTIETIIGEDGKHGFDGDGKAGPDTRINYVNQVAVDSQDNIYFADSRNHRVRRYDAKSGLVSTVAGNGKEESGGDGGPATLAGLNAPTGVAVDASGRVFISERGGKRIRLVLKDGTIRTLAGGGTFTGDGEASAMAFSEPHDLYIEPDGNMLFADSRAAKVRRIWLKWGL